MEQTADQRREQVRAALDGRSLAWFGIRGSDAAALLAFPEFRSSFAVTSAPHAASLDSDAVITLEHLSGVRVDLDAYDLDLDASDTANDFRNQVRRALSRPSVVVTYRPSAFVSALGFAMSEHVEVAGPFTDRQRPFEYKPWVESELRKRGLPVVPWTYIADQDQARAIRMLRSGPIVLRSSRDSGGVGIALVHDADELVARWPVRPDLFVAVAAFLADAVPPNVTGVVYPDGRIGIHAPSVQLIGIPTCTDRRFGYCGNDFGAVKRVLDPDQAQALDLMVRQVGAWLHEQRYLGVFGIDALVHDGAVLFTEINPRFQGSTALSARVAATIGESDLLTEHLAAYLGLDLHPRGLGIADWLRIQPDTAHLVVHHLGSRPALVDHGRIADVGAGFRTTLLPPPDVAVDPGGVLARLVAPGSVSSAGYDVTPAAAAAAEIVQSSATVFAAVVKVSSSA